MTRTYSCIAVLAALLIIGCTQAVTPNQSAAPSESVTVYGEELRTKAAELANAELIRLNAIELMYRNIPMQHQMQNPATFRINTGWTKVYRRFSGFDVTDVRRSDSLLTPIIINVEYQYEVFATPLRKEAEGSALQKTQNDKLFELRYAEVMTVNYGCNEQGEVINSDEEYMPRPNFFQIEELNEIVVGPKNPRSGN